MPTDLASSPSMLIFLPSANDLCNMKDTTSENEWLGDIIFESKSPD
jgi:hypothetical protein